MLRTMFFMAFAAVVSIEGARGAELPDPPPCRNCFVGELKLKPNPVDASGKTKLLDEDLYFVDSASLVWKAGAGDVTDGASIPELLQPIIGGPWEAAYLPAAVMHDHYTDDVHKVRTWQATARMFYAAMIVKNVEIIRAKLMYYAVYSFGPHWDKLKPGVPCGHNCLFSEVLQLNVQPADYHTDVDAKRLELDALRQQIADREIAGRPFTVDDLEEQARQKHPEQIFFINDNTR
jgi:Protein of unknown function (DUF1353)